MKIKLEYFERSPATGGQDYLGNLIGPHGTTVRWSYTIPTGKYAYIAYIRTLLMRDAAPGVLALAECYVNITCVGGGLSRIYTPMLSATVGDGRFSEIGNIGVYGPGDKFEGKTYDASTGGSHTYNNSMGYTEFT